MAKKPYQDNRLNARASRPKSGFIPEHKIGGPTGFIEPRAPGDPTGLIPERSTDKTEPPEPLKGFTSGAKSNIEMPGYALARAARG